MKLKVEKFENWAGNQESTVFSCYPKTKTDLEEVIRAAQQNNVAIRCAGARHSWAPVFSDDYTICVNTRDLQGEYGQGKKIRRVFIFTYCVKKSFRKVTTKAA